MPTNFNDSTPAPPSGHNNVAWQKDGTGNVSANIPTATIATLGLVKPDNATVTIASGVLSAIGSGGTVTAVTASSPLASSGGTAPNITITSPLPVANGGTGTTTPGIVAGTNITVSGTWPNQTVNSTGSVQTTRTISTTAPLTGGGDLSADRTLAVSDATSSTVGVVKPDNTTITISAGIISAVSTAANFADNETPSGTVNGSNVTFTLAHTPNPSASLLFFINGIQQIVGTDFTLSTATITMSSAPSTGALLRAFYRY